MSCMCPALGIWYMMSVSFNTTLASSSHMTCVEVDGSHFNITYCLNILTFKTIILHNKQDSRGLIYIQQEDIQNTRKSPLYPRLAAFRVIFLKKIIYHDMSKFVNEISCPFHLRFGTSRRLDTNKTRYSQSDS